jgi:DNA-binding CsgD family transcriptional regulator
MIDTIFQSVKRACYAGLDSVTLRREIAARIRPVVPFDAHAFGTTDPDTGLLTHLVAGHMPEAMTLEFLDHLYPFESARHAVDAARRGRVVYNSIEESAALSGALRSYGFEHGSHAVFGERGRLWGKWCLMQERISPAVVERTHMLIHRLAPHITRGLQQAALIDASAARERDPDASGTTGIASGVAAGVLVLDRTNRVLLRTEAVAPMLADLHDVGFSDPGAVPLAILALSARLRFAVARGRAETPHTLSLRAQGTSGRWYCIQASLAEPEAHGADAAVIIVRQVIAREVASMLTDIYGLSRREREVVAGVARGLTTKEIAVHLGLSPHTVKEHLDRACEKTGARGRKALVARIFFDAYVPQLGAASDLA